jgi:ABC-2 type transport system permease protein
MRKIWVVVRREFMERVRSRWFVIGTVLGPVLMVMMIVLPVVLARPGMSRWSLVVLDGTDGSAGRRLVESLRQTEWFAVRHVAVSADRVGRAADSLARLVELDVIHGFLVLPGAILDSGRAEYRGSNVLTPGETRLLQATVSRAVVAERLHRQGVDPAVIERAETPVEITSATLRAGGAGQSGEATFFLAYVVWFLLYISILLYGVQVMGSVVEEKSTRMVEVLVSSIDPFRLLAGKIAGVGAVGLLQMGIWVACGKLVVDRRVDLARLVDAGGETAAALAGLSLPAVPIAMVAVSLAYFLLGYFLYAAMFAAVAATVNTEAEARQAQIPVVMLLVVPSVMMVPILADPDGTMARVLSQIPLTASIAMPVRWAATMVAPGELAASLAVLGATVVGVTWVAGRIYRVGILMYGKKPGIREIARWVRG